MPKSIVILWFRNNLRIHDNEALHQAARHDRLIPIFIFDPRQFATTRFGFSKTGPHRTRFLLESLQNLRDNLQTVGSNLVIRHGKAEKVLGELAASQDVDVIFSEKEVAPEEEAVEQAVHRQVSAELQLVWANSLFHCDDIPYEPNDIPKVFTNFRKQVEKKSQVRECFPTPSELPTQPVEQTGDIPTPKKLGVEPAEIDERAALPFRGGEDAALQRLDNYFWQQDLLKSYKWTRNGLLGADYSSKFSPWLANGSLSARKIYWQVKRYEEQRKKNVSTYWMVFELIWRDYFRFSAMKYGSLFFQAGGIQQKEQNWRHDHDDFQRWAEGRTGIPFIDANMRELNQTGFMSNRGRQNVASFLSQNLNIDWRMGAEFFESHLLDYDVYSNYGNWMYNSTVGQDPRNRYFNILNQADKYDEKGEYVRHWLPDLKNVPVEFVHEPHIMPPDQQKLAGVMIGQDYPQPMLHLEESYKEIRKRG